MSLAFVHGFLLAWALILPMGPQNSFVISQGTTHVQYGRTVPVVITAALSDTILIAGAVLGASMILLALPVLKDVLTLLGIVFLGWMGWKSWRIPVHALSSDAGAAAYWTLRRRVMHTLRASLLNPHAIMDTVVVIGGGAAMYSAPAEKLSYALAAVLVSWFWFFALSLAGRTLGHLRHQARTLLWLNRVSAGIMWAIAGSYLVQLGHTWWISQS